VGIDLPTLQRRLLLLAAAVLVALAWLRPLDRLASAHVEAGLKRALAAYAVARTLNGVISVVQETGVSVQPGGVGMTFAPGQFLDPLNDLIEQVSGVMLAVCVSFGIQLLLLHIGGSALVSGVLTAGVAAAAWRAWRGRPVPRWGTRLLVAMLLVRFAVPVASVGSELTFRYAMADDYGAAQRQLEFASSDVAQGSPASATGGKAEPPQAQSVWEFLKTIPRWGDTRSEEPKERGRIEQIKARLDGAVEHILRLVAVFIVETVLLPLLFVGLLGKLLGAVLVPRTVRP
jgi:hypothetical protein